VKVAIFSTKPHDRNFLAGVNVRAGSPRELPFFEPRLELETAALAPFGSVVCAFVNDQLDSQTFRSAR
jgi:D-lactate dehydrogenase